MDYDDNDLHSQNFHLAGEGSTKFPPVLRPYALPKFDFDDSLQNQLRFDSLVETEVFLGIESNQDNHWIEDFSRGNSEIEFNSSAAEPCSISRRNNVWSEATSSESVEMLLKSVGQEEIIGAPTIIEEADACDELGCLTKQMEQSLKHGEKISSKTENVTNSEKIITPDEVAGNFSGLKGDVGVDQSCLEGRTQTQRGEVVGCSNAHDAGADGEKDVLHINVDIRSDDVNKRKHVIDDSADKHLYVQGQEDPFASRLEGDNLTVSTQTNDVQLQTNDANIEMPEDYVLSKGVEMENKSVDGNVVHSTTDEEPLTSAFKVETVAEMSVDGSTRTVEEPHNTTVEGHFELPTLHGQSKGESFEAIETKNCEDVVMTKDKEGAGDHAKPTGLEVQSEALKSDAQFERHAVEVSNISGQVPAALETKTDSGEGSSKSGDLESGRQVIGENLDHNHDTGLSSRDNLSAEIPATTILAEPTSICVNNKSFGEAGDIIHNQDISDGEKVGCSNMDIDSAGKEVGSSSIQGTTTSGNESDVASLNPTLASHDSNIGVVFPSKDGEKIGVDKDCQILAVPREESAQLEKKEETLSRTFVEPSISACIASSLKEDAAGSVSEDKEGSPCDNSAVLFGKTAVQSLPSASIVSEAQPTVEVGMERIEEINMSTMLCESTEKEGDVSEDVAVSDSKAPIDNIAGAENASDPITNEDEMLSQIVSVPVVESHVSTSQQVQESNGATLVTDDKGSGQTIQLSNINNGGGSSNQSVPSPALLDNGSRSADQRIPILGTPPSQSKNRIQEGVKDSMKQDASVPNVVIDGNAERIEPKSRARKGKAAASKEGKTASYDVTPSMKLAKGDAVKILPSLPSVASPMISEVSPSSSHPGHLDPKIIQEIVQPSTQVLGVEGSRGRPKGTSERKSGRSSGRSTGKERSKKGAHSKEITPARQPEKSNTVPINASGIFHVMQSNEMQPYGHVDGNSNKPYFVFAASSASLPDLNTSASPSTLFQQPFTDFQQVQLRAQIFVYGALIQCTVPEEAYMLSAFGGPDGGRSIWVNAWQASLERLHSQTSNPTNPETPLHSRQGTSSVKTVDQVSKQSALQSKSTSTPVGRSTTKTSQTIVSPMIPLSSPLWSMPTPVGDAAQSNVMPRGSIIDYQQALSPLHPFQTPPIRNLAGNNTSWVSQPSFRSPWVASSQPSVPESSTRFSSFPATEVVQLTTIKETTGPQSSAKPVSSGPSVQIGAPASVFTATSSPLVELKKVTPSLGQKSSEPKPRKRKKNSAPEEPSQIVLSSPSQAEPVLAPIISSGIATSAVIRTPASVVSQASEKFVGSVAPTPLFDPVKKVNNDFVQRAILSDESLGKIKEAAKQAEDATALAATAVCHSEEIWSQLENQKNSGLVSDVEAKLASAAIAIAAAAAVARAAAAAANVASSAALQAKLMAEEAFASNNFGNLSQGNIAGKATPASILKGEDRGNSSSSIITAAREAARRKVEAASAASKRAENMDAIVKAAELAAEAVSQAGKIVAMGDPLLLSELIEAGPEGYWRAPQVSPELVPKSAEMNKLAKAGVADITSTKTTKDGRSGKKGRLTTTNEQSSISNENLRLGGISGSCGANEKGTNGQKGHSVSDLTQNIVVVLESEPLTKSSSLNVESNVGNAASIAKENPINGGSKVEVFKDGDGFKAAWYPANVLTMNDGKAFVSYTELEQNEGSTQLEEWVPLVGDGDNPPRIRTARPVTAMLYEGTRKRRRAAMGDYNWSVGDRVDAWMTNSWWEGVVTEKNKRDETAVTVHFPVQVETSTVKAWHLRPSLIWKDGEWVEWSNLQHDSALHEGDIPREKRLKVGSPAVEAKGKDKDKAPKSSDVLDSGKPEESKLLDLSGTEKVFNIGKSSKNENKPETTRMVQTGLQKEGSRVVFGVPKPGKKRKFMEVSKHYVGDQSRKTNEPTDSIKHLKYSTNQGSGPRGLRSDPKEKRVAESKPRAFKPGKQQTAFGRTVPSRDNFTANAVSNSGDGIMADHTAKVKDSSSHTDSTSRKQSTAEAESLSNNEEVTEGSFVFSALEPSLEGPSSKKIPVTYKSERANKGKLAPAGRKLGKIEEDKVYHNTTLKSTSEAIEAPRRSNRRIQPTSRLLEGLQSSLIIPKFPSISHDKGHRSQSKHSSRGSNNG